MDSSILTGATLDALTERWWVPVVRGLSAILFGVIALAAPSLGLFALVITWGAYAVADGVLNLVLARRASRSQAKVGWFVVEGVIGIVAGLATFFNPGITAIALVFVIAGWAVLTGVLEIGAAIELRKLVQGEWMLALAGLLSIVFGGLLIVFPGAGALALVWLIAAYAISFGALLCGLGVRLRRMRGESARAIPASGVPSAV